MKNSICTGLLAAALAVLLPLFICGMGAEPPAASPTPLPSAKETAPASPSPTPRKIREFIVHEAGEPEAFSDEGCTLAVTVQGQEETMNLHDYLTGVLMGEMPASFSPEALKAQAVAARTYTLRRLEQGGTLSDDPSVCQAFLPLSAAPEKLGDDWEALLDKLRQAVLDTDGQVLTYGGQLISATYFSGSGGKTESAQAVWGSDLPYLQSVESPGEEDSSDYASTVSVPMDEFLSALDIDAPAVGDVSYTEGGGVDTIVIGGKAFTGLELRKLFGLRSTRFTLAITEDAVEFDVLGYGHRVGLSQRGAQAMAQAGHSYEEILHWYYTDVSLESYQN